MIGELVGGLFEWRHDGLWNGLFWICSEFDGIRPVPSPQLITR